MQNHAKSISKSRRTKSRKAESRKLKRCLCEFRKVEKSKSKNGLFLISKNRKVDDFLTFHFLNFWRVPFQPNMCSYFFQLRDPNSIQFEYQMRPKMNGSGAIRVTCLERLVRHKLKHPFLGLLKYYTNFDPLTKVWILLFQFFLHLIGLELTLPHLWSKKSTSWDVSDWFLIILLINLIFPSGINHAIGPRVGSLGSLGLCRGKVQGLHGDGLALHPIAPRIGWGKGVFQFSVLWQGVHRGADFWWITKGCCKLWSILWSINAWLVFFTKWRVNL